MPNLIILVYSGLNLESGQPARRGRKERGMLEYDTSLLEKRCRWIKQVLGDSLTWKWDDRFDTVLAEFNVRDKAVIQDRLSDQMDIIWTAETSRRAPEVIQILIDFFGGLNPDQQLFTSDPEIDGILLCAWWPWGNGETISIRLAVFADSLNDDQNHELTALFRGWFGV